MSSDDDHSLTPQEAREQASQFATSSAQAVRERSNVGVRKAWKYIKKGDRHGAFLALMAASERAKKVDDRDLDPIEVEAAAAKKMIGWLKEISDRERRRAS